MVTAAEPVTAQEHLHGPTTPVQLGSDARNVAFFHISCCCELYGTGRQCLQLGA